MAASAKGLVKEVDALGGAMHCHYEGGIQFRILIRARAAVRATGPGRRILYKAAIRRRLENQPNLNLFQQAVDDLMVEGTGWWGGDASWHSLRSRAVC